MDFSTSPLLTAVVAAAASIITAIGTLVFGRPKQKADVHSAIATSAGMAVDTITDVLNEVRLELEEARREIESLREANAQLRQSVALLNHRITELHGQTQKSTD